MFDIAPTELLLCAVVALVVIGPKDLPNALRHIGRWVARARGMAKHFRTGLDTMMREAELEDMEKQWKAHNEAIMRAHPAVVIKEGDAVTARAGDDTPDTAAVAPADAAPAAAAPAGRGDLP